MKDDKLEPIIGSIENTDFAVTIEKLEIGDDEKNVDAIQIAFKSLDLNWLIYSHLGQWVNHFFHTPTDDGDKIPRELTTYSMSVPMWMVPDPKFDKHIKKVFNWCGLDNGAGDNIKNAVSGIIASNALMDKIDIPIESLDKYAYEKLEMDAEIDYENPLWFMINKKFSGKAVADRVIEIFKEQKHFIKTIKETKVILIFHEGMYVSGEDEVERLIRDLLKHSATNHFVKETISEIKSATLTLLSDFNPGDCINMQNGVYKIHLKTFYNGTDGIYDEQEMLFTYKSPVHYDPDAICPGIDKFFKWALPDEIQRMQVYEEFAYGFAPGFPIQRMFLYWGTGANGKGVAVTILRHIIGAENISGWSVYNLENNNDYCQANMVTKKFNICGDMPSQSVPFDFIKAASGGDIIPVRQIREPAYNTINSCKMLFMVNNMPEISDFSDGALRRIIPTLWNSHVTGTGIDPHLSEKLTTPEELSGFFNVLMDSYDVLMERGHFIFNPTIEETEATLSELRGEEEKEFIRECCVINPNSRYDRKAMYEDYCNWHATRQTKPKTKKIFNGFIRSFGYNHIKYGGSIVWTGIGKLNTEATQASQNMKDYSKEHPDFGK